MRVLAVIPARGGSKRLPGKNTKPLFGKPLICWTIDFAKTISWISELQVSTDSREIASMCLAGGVVVERLRPANFATDEASSVDVVLDLLNWLEFSGKVFDAIAFMQPTTPVRYPERWQAAYESLTRSDVEGVVGVSISDVHPFLHFKKNEQGFLAPWVDNPMGVTRSQDYPFSCSINGSLYLIKVDAFKAQRTFIPKKCVPILCSDQVENIDIDTSLDWRLAEILISDWMDKR
jgi:CMP-N,N'-diacetyllegionaminic acid synthase